MELGSLARKGGSDGTETVHGGRNWASAHEALGFEIAMPFKELSTRDALPALVAIIVESWRILDDSSHSAPFFSILPLCIVMAQPHLHF